VDFYPWWRTINPERGNSEHSVMAGACARAHEKAQWRASRILPLVAARVKQSIEVQGRTLQVSNLDKVLFPSGFTKGQVIDFYIRVADFLLPHIAGRPVTLKRYPNGIEGKHFYEKDAPSHTPDWVERFAVPRRSGESDIHYVLLNDLPSLVWSANLANLEIHPFLAKAPHIERPSFIVFDLDPGEGADLLDCAEVAELLKEKLEGAKLEAFAKVSGSKGLQVYAPLNGAATYDATQPYARELAQVLERDHPELVISDMSKALRKGKVFIDWSQNSDFKTTVAPYSLRAKKSSPFVSMPVTWDELRKARRKREIAALYFDPDAALKRLEKTGDLFAPVLTLKQRIPARRLDAR
jgi:bifunctional non-homologous end joining protein LigD